MIEQGAVGGSEGPAGAQARPGLAGDAGDRRSRDRGLAATATSTREEAIAAGQQATRRYAKRQYTWFAHQPPADWPRFREPLEDDATERALALLGGEALSERPWSCCATPTST